MKINKVRLQNFKCFNNADIKLAKITLLTGANSSGKSSFLYSILAMLQSENFPFYLSPNGKFVDLGSFKEISFNYDHKNAITISVEINRSLSYYYPGPFKFDTIWIENKKNKLPQLEQLDFSSPRLQIRITKKERQYYFSISDSGDTNFILSKIKEKFLAIKQIKKAKKIIVTRRIIEIIDAPFDSINSIFEEVFFDENFHFLSRYSDILGESFNSLNKDFNFIGSFREPPLRTYYQKSKSNSKVDIAGTGYIDQILEWEEANNKKFKELLTSLRQLQLLVQLKSQKLKGGRFELKVRVNKGGILSSLTDVGFGISQFVPIIVSDLQLPDDSLLMMAQPEIHLHPQIQATLGDYVTRQVKRKRKQYIIETHSEYLLNRIRLNIVMGELSPKDVAIYYFINTKGGTKIFPISFSQKGEINGAPKEFFDTYMIDIMNIALNA